ncbi:ATP-binding cassette domain-containing protein [Pseudophaeobacter leonis]|uniref:ATP-binding cassette domain-containing protein n=1 Tax=Pseudophaeobacter leonis TaxID=1144477 RepID=UPI0024092CFA|nr:ATP-binding cassette domain-containing protein [Pseudophaeobacter leonis]
MNATPKQTTAATPMLEVTDLHAYYGKSHVLNGVNMKIMQGEVIALLGRNGVGRSTTATAIVGEVPPVGVDQVPKSGNRWP